jgi:hypothetical protein
MNPVYFRELKRYSQSDLNEKLSMLNMATLYSIIKTLKEKNILKQKENNLFSFEFVGVLILGEVVLFCIPKYIKKLNKKSIMKQLLMLFREYSKRENLDENEMESIGSIESTSEYNMLSVIIYLLNDFIENGLYSNEKNIYVFNGEDEINWLKTIEDVQPILNYGEPVYIEYYTNATQNDEENYFRLLHQYVLNECTRILRRIGLDEYLGFDPVDFDVDGDRLGTPQSILSRIINELNVQFVDRKQMILKAIYSFISKEKTDTDNFAISFYGTRKFHIVWEKTCAYILDNKYDDVKKHIGKPKWRTASGKNYEAETLIPDIITMYKQSMKKYFIISDAKYYDIKLSDTKFDNNPGVGDVTKQYLYQLTFMDYINMQKFDVIQNVLLFPTEENEISQIGTVTIEFLKKLDLEDILVIKFPAYMVFEMYINGKRLDIGNYVDFLS